MIFLLDSDNIKTISQKADQEIIPEHNTLVFFCSDRSPRCLLSVCVGYHAQEGLHRGSKGLMKMKGTEGRTREKTKEKTQEGAQKKKLKTGL